jgi:hypothetical protein
VVTANGTTYWVKALDKEIRLSKVALVNCTNAGLATPTVGTVTLPAATDWQDPTVAGKTAGSAPVVTDAPKVIHGVKQY